MSIHEPRPAPVPDFKSSADDSSALHQRVLSLRLPQQEPSRGSGGVKVAWALVIVLAVVVGVLAALLLQRGSPEAPAADFPGATVRGSPDGILRQHCLGFQGLHHARAADPRQPEGQRHDRQARYSGRPPGEEGRRSGRVGRRRLPGRPGGTTSPSLEGPATVGGNRGHASQRDRPGQGRGRAG